MSPVPHIVLTACSTVSLSASEDPVRDVPNNAAEKRPSRDRTDHPSLRQTFNEIDFCRGLSQPKSENVDLKQELALLLTETEVRAVTFFEARKLREFSGKDLKTLTISASTKDGCEVRLEEFPLLVLFVEKIGLKEAYRQLLSTLNPRVKSSLHSVRQKRLAEALRRGMESGDVVLRLQNNTVTIPPDPSGSLDRGDQRRSTGDVRRSAYMRLDSLEETIRELENTLIEISGHSVEQLYGDTNAPAQTPISPASVTKKPPVPPKPSSASAASVQVHSKHLLLFFLHFFSLSGCQTFSNL